MSSQRKPMTFNVAAPTVVAPASIKRAEGTERQQVGARVTKATYRQLKARAALNGVTVQALVEQAIDEFLAKTTA
jgi:predicted HicB family RNase H-like nuclease